jgi:hypothetical protein
MITTNKGPDRKQALNKCSLEGQMDGWKDRQTDMTSQPFDLLCLCSTSDKSLQVLYKYVFDHDITVGSMHLGITSKHFCEFSLV